MDLWEVGWGAQTGFIWLRIGTGGGLLCIRWGIFGFHKMRGISWVASDILASQEGLCSMEIVSTTFWQWQLLSIVFRNSYPLDSIVKGWIGSISEIFPSKILPLRHTENPVLSWPHELCSDTDWISVAAVNAACFWSVSFTCEANSHVAVVTLIKTLSTRPSPFPVTQFVSHYTWFDQRVSKLNLFLHNKSYLLNKVCLF
jgi:hypothetical protein